MNLKQVLFSYFFHQQLAQFDPPVQPTVNALCLKLLDNCFIARNIHPFARNALFAEHPSLVAALATGSKHQPAFSLALSRTIAGCFLAVTL